MLIEGELKIGKPKPEVFQHAEAQCGYKGGEILFVGNSYRHDMAPAMAAGWRNAWVRRASDVPPSSKETEPAPLPEGAQEPEITMSDLRDLFGPLGLD